MLESMKDVSPFSLDRDQRLRKRKDFLKVQRYGVRAFGRFVVAIAQSDGADGLGRFGITVPKRVGKAHLRNRIKRRIRHIMRLDQKLFFRSAMVVVVKESAIHASFSDLSIDIADVCGKLSYRLGRHSLDRIRTDQKSRLRSL